MAATTFRELSGADAEAVCELRLAGLRSDPGAFAISAEEERARPMATLEQALTAYLSTADRAVFGAFDDALVGMVGVERLSGDYLRHKARLWGLYVAPGQRHAGVGSELVSRSVAMLRGLSGVEMLLLEVSDEAAAARRLYEKLRFTHLSTEPQALKVGDRYVAEHRMVLSLMA